MVGEVLGKVSIFVLVIWVVIGVGVLTLFPFVENTTDRLIDSDSKNSQPVNVPNNLQSDFNSGNSLYNIVPDNSQSVTGF